MNYVIQVQKNNLNFFEKILVENMFVGLVTTTIVRKRLWTRSLDQQIILTKDISDAETYATLIEAQNAIIGLKKINNTFIYTICEAKDFNKRRATKKPETLVDKSID